jgi:hypothetical protein
MGKLKLLLACAALALGIVAAPLTASPPPEVVESFEYTDNMVPRGYSPKIVPLTGEGSGNFNSDLAFWGDWAFQGSYDGFRIIDINFPSNPREFLFQPCNGNQGDVVVWGDSPDRPDLLVRSYNTPAPAGVTCDGQPIPVGFEGVHVFDLSNFGNPQLVAQVPTTGGSHTATLVPDTANNRVIIYNQTSGSTPPFISIIEVPLNNLAGTSVIGTAPLTEAGACHDSGVILGSVNKMVCASHDHANVFDIGANEIPGGSLTSPQFLFTISEPGVCNEPGNPLCNGNWHSGAFTWDGEVIILGWEPGGGSQAECEATDPDVKKSWFFYDADTGAKLGQFVLPRPQTATENCTIHNYNVVPLKNKAGKPRYVLVGGNYQAGISVVDFTNPAAAREVAYADPAPLSATQLILGGDWSTYWYNGRIYESDIKRGLIVWRLDDDAVSTYRTTPHLNPQTQEFSID